MTSSLMRAARAAEGAHLGGRCCPNGWMHGRTTNSHVLVRNLLHFLMKRHDQNAVMTWVMMGIHSGTERIKLFLS